MTLFDLKTLHMDCPVIDETPEFSWKLNSDKENVLQEAYQIVVTTGDQIVWDSGRVLSREQSFVEYKGSPLTSMTEYTWMVTVWSNQGDRASASTTFETAFLQKADWKASWIEYSGTREKASDCPFGSTHAPVLFEKKFQLTKKVEQARAYATSYGTYRLTVNGERPDDREMAPEYTPYEKTLYYQTYDITDLLQGGANKLAMYVADGWYFSAQAGPVTDALHAEPSVLFQVEITYEDGTFETICSDGTETCRTDFIAYSDLYQGEKQDFTATPEEARPVLVKDYGYDLLQAQPLPPIKVIQERNAVEVFTTPAGETIVDFGQVIAGRARINVWEPAGTEVVFEYFEVLDCNGNYTNTMFAPQKDTVISNGQLITHEALFTFHGFRYIKVTGMETVEKEDFTAVLLSTEKENKGSFTCSDARLNRLYKNIRYSQYNNMMSVPTDCPSREKAGWTGDILIYAETAMNNENMTPLLGSWLRSLRADQMENGVVSIVAPYMKLYDYMLRGVCKDKYGEEDINGVAGWSDAIVWVPYDMYRNTGNRCVLEDNYSAMVRWADYIVKTAHDKRGYKDIPEEYDQYLWNTGFHFGEWLVPHEGGAPKDDAWYWCIFTAYYVAPYWGYMTLKKMTEICRILGDAEKAASYAATAEKMKWAIQEGMMRRGVLPENYMGAYILAFAFDLVPEDLKASYQEHLLTLLHDNGDCLDTGFLATPYIMDVLCDLGEEELAHSLLWQDKMPSWLYEVDHGATSIWEAWDADGAQTNHRYISYDHYAFGCVDNFLFHHVAGIHSIGAGYQHILIAPEGDSRLDYFNRTFDCEAGTIAVLWTKEKLTVTIPANTTATVRWNGETHEVGSGTYTF